MKLRQPQPIAMRVVLGVLCLAHTAHGLHVPRGGGWTRLSAAARPAAGLSFPGSWRRPTVRLAAAETTSEIELEVGLSEEADIRAYFGMVQESGTISYLGTWWVGSSASQHHPTTSPAQPHSRTASRATTNPSHLRPRADGNPRVG